VLLVQNGYSREMEREADRAAATYLVRAYGSTRPLRDILTRLTAGSGDDDLSGLLSTHPATSERLRELAAFDPPRPARR
jgi:predicted Zn-dependent protease